MFHKTDTDWHRQECFNHYMNKMRCTYSITVQIDITNLLQGVKDKGLKIYPAQIYLISKCVNSLKEFQLGVSESGETGYWDILHPAYTVFNSETKTFSGIWTYYNDDFNIFYESCMKDIELYSKSTDFEPKKDLPVNSFNISSVPWVDFTSFNINVYNDGTHLQPIFTIGKFTKQNGKTTMPLAIQLHHATADGYHVGQLIDAIKTMTANCNSWL